jgi:hypothetical protein
MDMRELSRQTALQTLQNAFAAKEAQSERRNCPNERNA